MCVSSKSSANGSLSSIVDVWKRVIVLVSSNAESVGINDSCVISTTESEFDAVSSSFRLRR